MPSNAQANNLNDDLADLGEDPTMDARNNMQQLSHSELKIRENIGPILS